MISKRAKEDDLATLLEQEKGVEHLEQVGGGLVDRADHRALSGRHLADGSHHNLIVILHNNEDEKNQQNRFIYIFRDGKHPPPLPYDKPNSKTKKKRKNSE